jgi:hypothetical protein
MGAREEERATAGGATAGLWWSFHRAQQAHLDQQRARKVARHDVADGALELVLIASHDGRHAAGDRIRRAAAQPLPAAAAAAAA